MVVNNPLKQQKIKITYRFYNHIFCVSKNLEKFLNFFLPTIFFFTKNVIFFGFNSNVNYLPFNSTIVQKRSSKKILKLLRFYNIGCIVYKNNHYCRYTFSILSKSKIPSVFLNNNSTLVDFGVQENLISEYLIYVCVLNLYLKTKIKHKVKWFIIFYSLMF